MHIAARSPRHVLLHWLWVAYVAEGKRNASTYGERCCPYKEFSWKRSLPSGHIHICCSRIQGLVLIGRWGEGKRNHAELQSYDLAAMTEFSLSFLRRRMCDSTILGLQSNCESNNFWSDLKETMKCRGELAKQCTKLVSTPNDLH